MTLEPRLLAVAHFIKSNTHADIGSDHALLPKYLLEHGYIQKAIVVEKNQQPFHNAALALKGLNADVRLGDGLGPLHLNEASSLSITGMGTRTMVDILQAHPERLPHKLTLQPNDNARDLRVWATSAGFHLQGERMVQGFWRYTILHLEMAQGADPSYQDIPLEAALTYGPHLLSEKHPLLLEELEYQRPYLQKLGTPVAKQLAILEQALNYLRDASRH